MCAKYSESVFTWTYSPVLSARQSYDAVSQCGIVESPLIVGGTKASDGEFPHLAAIGYSSRQELVFLCAGSLISERFVLTAGHCGHTPE